MDVEQVAGRLTEAQRAWLLSAEPTLEPVSKQPCAEWWNGPALYVEVGGKDHWLGSRSMCSPAGSAKFETGEEKLSSLGLAVRAHLQAQPR